MRPTDHLPKTCKKYDLSIDARTRLTAWAGRRAETAVGQEGRPDCHDGLLKQAICFFQ